MTQKQVYSNYHPPTYEACNIILLNMKNHYRRLYSVKPAVDTSPPESYKLLTRKTSRSLSCLDLSLSNLSSFKLCQRPDIKHEVQNHEMQRTAKSINKRHSCIGVDKAANQHCRERNRVKPSISSCHRNPRTVLINMENSKVYTPKEKVLDSGKACSESSQDSAYNEGEIGSSERGSRTPTPETVVNTSSKIASNPALGSSTYCRRTRSYLYLKFLAEITDEILKKGVVTNKALKRIFNHHLEANIYHLNQHRMQLELETLRNKLGIPEDDAQNAADFGVGSGEGPTCQPLFHDLPGFDDQMSTKSVLQKGLLTSKWPGRLKFWKLLLCSVTIRNSSIVYNQASKVWLRICGRSVCQFLNLKSVVKGHPVIRIIVRKSVG
ncbi:unnamed protein product [Bemisia tabaci]|uniref:Uncharacterized protein n=1 Tax=Bemisia tabaci TaxID=7038 RepID=A0A9P0F4M5_BEMTA|nr:unnamed protein product [Bemisia tabaci]